MDTQKPSFDFPKKIFGYERAEMIRIEGLIENFKWIQKISVQLGTIGQSLFKNLQKVLTKIHTPPNTNALSFEYVSYVENLEAILSEFGKSNDKLSTAINCLSTNFQNSVEKVFSSVCNQITKLRKDHQKIASMKQQYAEVSHEILNMELGCSGSKVDKAMTQTKTKAYKLKQTLEANEKTYKERIAIQHSALEESDWTAMCFIAEAMSLIGEYFTKMTKDLERISSILKTRAQSDKTKKIMEDFAAYVAALPIPQLTDRSSEAPLTAGSISTSPSQNASRARNQEQLQSPIQEKDIELEQTPEPKKELEKEKELVEEKE